MDSNPGALLVYGSGAYPRYFTQNLDGSFTSPPDDFGTLVQNGDGTFTYTAKNQLKWNFDSSGLLKTVVDPHNLATTLTYSAGLLSTIQMPDGGITTFSFTDTGSRLRTITEPGNRVVTLSHDASGNLTGLTDSDGRRGTFTYDSGHHLTSESWGVAQATFSWDSTNGRLTGGDRGSGTTFSAVPAAGRLGTGVLAASAAVSVWPVGQLGRLGRLLGRRLTTTDGIIPSSKSSRVTRSRRPGSGWHGGRVRVASAKHSPGGPIPGAAGAALCNQCATAIPSQAEALADPSLAASP